MKPCLDAIVVITAFAEGASLLEGFPGDELVCIRLGEIPGTLMDRVCAFRGLQVIRIERRQFPDGEDTVYLVQVPAGT
jgi:hypothetical protein